MVPMGSIPRTGLSLETKKWDLFRMRRLDGISSCIIVIITGTRVVRGQDWKWGNQDGGEGFVGTVVQVGKDKKSPVTEQLVYVQWDCGGKYDYRAGIEGKHDLRVFCLTNGGE
ncbi:hypothetical protein pdam_00013362 [Pocillopora damicornis]|uniref:MIB/HERC2 domain-containing protein n=1 Tax=Pocillopora damicornis TaxID=46731 RepID=A0A3M6U7M0_POCDA|nr:hypothetical protein pdam_00013362 [Pocillopora damicornis]